MKVVTRWPPSVFMIIFFGEGFAISWGMVLVYD